MTRQTTFSFTLDPTPEQAAALCRHVGAARFAFNQCLRLVLGAFDSKKDQPEARVPWSGFDLINAFNAWKRSPEAGVDPDGKPGLVWRDAVCQQVYEEAAVDLGRALEAVSAWRRRERKGKRPHLPRFKKKQTARRSFRLRNKGSGTKSALRLGEGSARSIRLPKLGTIAVRECTRKLRRMLDKGRAKIWFATVSQRVGGHWRVTLNVEAEALHPQQRHDPNQRPRVVGIDRGLTTFAVLADRESQEVERIESPRPLREALPELRRRSRALSRKQKGSRNRYRARVRLSRLHQRIADLRKDFVHRQTTRLAKTHGHLVLEKLCTSGLIRSRLSRAIADSAWAQFATLLTYKASWYGAVLTVADRLPEHAALQRVRGDGSRAPAERAKLSLQQLRTRGRPRHERRSVPGAVTPRYWRPATGLTSPRSTRRRKTSVERRALARDRCGSCVKLPSVKQKGLRPSAREGQCWQKLSTRFRNPTSHLWLATLTRSVDAPPSNREM